MKRSILLAIATFALAASDYGQTRSSFQHKVAGKTLDEAISSVGKPAREEARSTGETVLVYEKKTFKKDAKSGRFEYWGIEFIPL